MLVEMRLECALHRHLDARPLLPLAALRGDFVDACRGSSGAVGFLEPLLQERFELAHIFKA